MDEQNLMSRASSHGSGTPRVSSPPSTVSGRAGGASCSAHRVCDGCHALAHPHEVCQQVELVVLGHGAVDVEAHRLRLAPQLEHPLAGHQVGALRGVRLHDRGRCRHILQGEGSWRVSETGAAAAAAGGGVPLESPSWDRAAPWPGGRSWPAAQASRSQTLLNGRLQGR